MLEKDLQVFGLSENEAMVYLVTLKLGASSALEIAKETLIKRPTAYLVLESLQRKGFIHIEYYGLKRKFVAASPEKLEENVDSLKKRYYKILPELLSLHKLKGQSGLIKYYEGLDGLKSLYETILRELRPGEPYYIITKQENWYELDATWFEDFVERRARRSLDTRIIFQESERAQRNIELRSALNQQVKILPKKTNYTSDVIICPQRYIIHSLTPPITAVSIENEDIINTQLQIFLSLWDSLPQLLQTRPESRAPSL